MPSFSVIIPTFNRAATIGATLESLFAQRMTDFEAIVVDDGSTDDTPTILNRFADRIRVIVQPNAGPGAARNAGIAAAQSDYIAFLDSDDLWFPWTLQTYARAIEANARPAIVFGQPLFWNSGSKPPDVNEDSLRMRYSASYLESIDGGFVPAACIAAFRTDQLREIGGFVREPINYEDHDLLLRLGSVPGCVRIDAPYVAAYRQHSGGGFANPGRSYLGMLNMLDRELSGAYPGSSAQARRARRKVISISARIWAWNLLHERRLAWAWALYRRSLLYNVAEMRLAFVAGFPILSVASAIGLYRRKGVRSARG